MLVLSRRQDDKVLFPNLGISVHILRVEGNKVRVGVEAPPEVKILRHELQDRSSGRELPSSHRQGVHGVSTTDDRQLRRRLHDAAESLNELYQLCDRDLQPGSEQLIFDIFKHLRSIDEESASSEPVSKPPVNRLRRALLVEDNLNERKLLAGYLRMQKFDVDVASDGAAAIDYLDSHEAPDVVLLDMQMPGVDGPSAIRHLRADEKHNRLKVYAVSGADPCDYGVDIGPTGVDGWFPKPLDPEALVFRLAFDSSSGSSTTDRRNHHRKDSMTCN